MHCALESHSEISSQRALHSTHPPLLNAKCLNGPGFFPEDGEYLACVDAATELLAERVDGDGVQHHRDEGALHREGLDGACWRGRENAAEGVDEGLRQAAHVHLTVVFLRLAEVKRPDEDTVILMFWDVPGVYVQDNTR